MFTVISYHLKQKGTNNIHSNPFLDSSPTPFSDDSTRLVSSDSNLCKHKNLINIYIFTFIYITLNFVNIVSVRLKKTV